MSVVSENVTFPQYIKREGTSAVKDVEILSDLKQIKAVSHVYRIRILEAFHEKSATAKQISDRLNEPHAKVNYHIKALVNVAILEPAGENIRMGIVEKYYQPVAKSFRVDSSVMKMSDAQIKASVDHASVAAFERASRQFYESLELKERIVANRITNIPEIYLTDSEAKDFFSEFDKLIHDYAVRYKEPRPESTRHFTSLLLVPCGK